MRRITGFTIVELLTVLAIIALLTGILVPSLKLVRNVARETKQKAQFATIDQALMAFRSDYGDYPLSDNLNLDYCGAQKLAEALVGWDLLGFHPDSDFRALGDISNPGGVYDSTDNTNLDRRIGPYLDVATANAFTLQQLFESSNPGFLNGNTFVLCDSFGVKKITIGQKTVKAGTPILYYMANTNSKRMVSGSPTDVIYNFFDNQALCSINSLANNSQHPLADEELFYNENNKIYKIIDSKIFDATGRKWPHRADSYILISAGADGLYGTNDDITNFGN